ncbi:hypothetical protein BKA70DRAFT_1286041 [Coprinopsis sp. MPI-PUGE-AT-0042]|nr:hypothetical protein BKA70DRAFT_1286041 [Coprinopsis sp. MPI-PUGE-AT-0042]
MLLIIASGNPYNSNYCTEDGQVIYKVDSPFKLVGRTATISKKEPTDESLTDTHDQFTRIGQIEFNALMPSRITWKGETKDTSAFFRKGEKKMGSWLRKVSRIFKGPDGVEYRWDIGRSPSNLPTLYLNTDPNTIIAKYRKKHLSSGGVAAAQQGHGVAGSNTVATLEISEPGEHMADIIVITLAYIEKLRRGTQAV